MPSDLPIAKTSFKSASFANIKVSYDISSSCVTIQLSNIFYQWDMQAFQFSPASTLYRFPFSITSIGNVTLDPIYKFKYLHLINVTNINLVYEKIIKKALLYVISMMHHQY